MNEMIQNTSLSIIESVNTTSMTSSLQKINQFQQLVQSQMKQNHDYGIIPGTKKPTLLKPGAEKIIMLLGLTSEFEIVESTRDFDLGFFQYQVRCSLYKNGICITQGMGAGNTKETKYIQMDAYTVDNTVLKMAKKRAMVDAALLVGSLSDVFTQDIEDMDLAGEQASTQKNYATDTSGTISQAQAKRIFGIAKGNNDLVRTTLEKYGYKQSTDVKKIDYDKVCIEIEQAVTGE